MALRRISAQSYLACEILGRVALSPAQIAHRALDEIFNQRDSALTRAAFDELSTAELTLIDPEGTSYGIDELVQKVVAAHAVAHRISDLRPCLRPTRSQTSHCTAGNWMYRGSWLR